MSKVCARRLMAGIVKPATSPRARASYRPWMLADRAPSSWLASQTSHCAAAAVASSSVKAAVQARSRMPSARNPASSSMTSRSPSRCARPASAVSRSAGEVATWGIGLDLLSGGTRSWYRRDTVPHVNGEGSAARLDDHQEDDDDDQQPEEDPAALDLLDGRHDLRRR